MPDDIWKRLRRLGTRVEDELFDLTEEEEAEDESQGRNTIVALLNAFLTVWKTNEANYLERVLGLAGLGSLLWLVIGDRGMGVKKAPLRIATGTFAAVWFLPGLIASVGLLRNLGFENLRAWRIYPLLLTGTAGGLISFRAVFGELSQQRMRPVRREEPEAVAEG
ncbi:MAG: hypothetical protein HYS09_09270 [Chloroflexi bacterium]|nr:hypothetical protein [Chloroflexota bacterium]